MPAGGRFATTFDLTCNRPIHGGSAMEWASKLESLGTEIENLPLGPRSLLVILNYGQMTRTTPALTHPSKRLNHTGRRPLTLQISPCGISFLYNTEIHLKNR
ncbi:hypothetical protein AVEN_238366-1 [Araneus ventricosus]|uniref:Uncharacterized protein n=1 Tax=Araneus ventricosus TaxID=182803 RepID=A0A4Y2LKU2_ARAVE|nr:hypothetical protein AVEN_238366-1 [Araneus ventricosus]